MKVDIVIIGAGTAGLSALREVQRFTEDFLLVNDGHWGTTCAAVDCMPSKALIEAANAFHRRRTFEEFGFLGAGALRADVPAVLARVRKMRDGFVKGPLIEAEFSLHLGAQAELEEADGAIRVTGAGGSFEADAVLAAMGRRPNIDDLELETFGVRLDDKGMPEVDPATLRIGDLPVFLAGDANGYRPLLHEAADERHIVGRMTAPDATSDGLCRRTPLSIVFSSPQVARVGPPLSELGERDIVSGSVDFSRQARARMAQTAAGLLRIHAERDNGRLVAAEMCVPEAEHLAHLLALAVERQLTVADMLAMPFYHPDLEEGLRSALRDLSKEVAGTGGSDLSRCEAIGHDSLD